MQVLGGSVHDQDDIEVKRSPWSHQIITHLLLLDDVFPNIVHGSMITIHLICRGQYAFHDSMPLV